MVRSIIENMMEEVCNEGKIYNDIRRSVWK